MTSDQILAVVFVVCALIVLVAAPVFGWRWAGGPQLAADDVELDDVELDNVERLEVPQWML